MNYIKMIFSSSPIVAPIASPIDAPITSAIASRTGSQSSISSNKITSESHQYPKIKHDNPLTLDLLKWNIILQIVLAGLYWGHQWIGFWDLDFDMNQHVVPINYICWILVPILLLYILQKFVNTRIAKIACIAFVLIIFFLPILVIILWALKLTGPQPIAPTVNGKLNWQQITTLQIGDSVTLGVDVLEVDLLYTVFPSHTYRWSPNGETTKEIIVSPNITTEYIVTVMGTGAAEPDRDSDDATILVIVGDIINCDTGMGPNSGIIICNDDKQNICTQLNAVGVDAQIGKCPDEYSYFKLINKHSGMCPFAGKNTKSGNFGHFDSNDICSRSNCESYCDEYWHITNLISNEAKEIDYFQLQNQNGKCMINTNGKTYSIGKCDDINNIVNFENYWYKEYDESAENPIYFKLKTYTDNKCLYASADSSSKYGFDASCGQPNGHTNYNDVYWKIESVWQTDLEQCKPAPFHANRL